MKGTKTFSKYLCYITSLTLLIVSTVSAFGSMYMYSPDYKSPSKKIKNIIILIPDGCNNTIQTISRWYKGQPLAVDELTSGSVQTWMTNSIIPGSAAAGTAFATGYKTEEPLIGVGPSTKGVLSTYQFPLPPEYLSYRPLASVLEAAKYIGKSTGMIATSTISHATPAAFSSHIDNRSKEFDIIEHQVYQNVDVVFGGGLNKLVSRSDKENLRDTLISRGYQFAQTRDDMLALSHGRVWGMFAGEAMQPEVDRELFGPTEPSLPEMTRKAIELLSQNPRGFLLVIEGSQIDWAGHNNDPIYMVKDFIAFDDAVAQAVAFAKRDGQTAVLAFPDHNTGGMSLGSYYSDMKVPYDRMPVEMLVNPLKGMKLSSAGVAAKIYNKNDPAEIISAVQTWWGITLTNEDIDEIQNWPLTPSFNYRLASVVSKNYTSVGWTTYGHTGDDVPLWTYNCDLRGTIENTRIAEKVFELLGVNSNWLNKELFIDADSVFPGAWSLNNTDSLNPVFSVTIDNLTFRMPINKDVLFYKLPSFGRIPQKDVTVTLRGLVIHAPKTNRVYIPADALRHITMISKRF